MKYRAEIDGLRAIAVVSVILFHAGLPYIGGGYVGVDIFFVISGYLISTIIFNEVEQQKFSFVTFYERRARRIIPALSLVMLASIIPAFLLLQPNDLVSFGKSLIAIPIFLSNVLFWSERGYFGTASELKPLIHTWSLAVEEQFYLLYPVVIMALYKWCRKYLVAILTVILLVSLVASYYVTRLHFDTAFFLPFTRAWELLIGGMAALFIRNGLVQRYRVSGTLLSAVGVGMMFYSIIFFSSKTLFPGVAAAIPVIGTFLVLISSQENNQVHRFLSNKVFAFLGLTSYSLYLWHQPVFAYITHLDIGKSWLYASLILVVALSAISYKWVETPFRNKQKIDRKKVFVFAALSSLFFIALGGVIVLNKGFSNRYNEEDRKMLESVQGANVYNFTRFDALNLKNFEEGNKRKVLLVGDSFAKDALNLVLESDLNQRFTFSTKQINSECGNIYVPFDKEQYISENQILRCNTLGWYESTRMKELMGQADEIWLVGRWVDWVAPYVGPSVVQMQKDYNKPVRVFGIKNFGKSSTYEGIKVPADKRNGYTQPAQPEAVAVEKAMRDSVPAENYTSFLEIFCGKDFQTCPVFTPDGGLISQDGGHLTEAGAKYLSKQLEPELKKSLPEK